jgi:hypothetical protein
MIFGESRERVSNAERVLDLSQHRHRAVGVLAVAAVPIELRCTELWKETVNRAGQGSNHFGIRARRDLSAMALG